VKVLLRYGVCAVEKWLCRGAVVKVRQAECFWLWSWRRNKVFVDWRAHLSEDQAAGDGIAQQLSWIETDDGREKEKIVEGLEFAG
jgi:hypothetical protein